MLAEPYIGEIRQFSYAFHYPQGWLPCDGSVLQIGPNQALFAVLGNRYGGDGLTTFALPDLRGRAALGCNNENPLGTALGQEAVALTEAHIPKHTHEVLVSDSNAQTNQASGNSLAVSMIYTPPTSNTGHARPETIAPGTIPHNNMQPSMVTRFCIAAVDQPGMEQFIGEIRLFPFDKIPYGWLRCEGQSLEAAKEEYKVLYMIIKNTFGSTDPAHFNLPDFRGRIPVGVGPGPGLTPRTLGARFGAEWETLGATVPAHNHAMMAAGVNAQSNVADGNLLANGVTPGRPPVAFPTYIAQAPNAPMLDKALEAVGNGGSHDNRQPALALSFCIAYAGVFPPHPDSAAPKK